MSNKPPIDRSMSQSLALSIVAGQAGCTMVLLLLAGLIAGIWTDSLLGTHPLFTLVLMLTGIIIGPFAAIKMVLSAPHAPPTGQATVTETNDSAPINHTKEDSL